VRYADLANLRYTKQVILETLRLYPPIWILPRRVRADLEIAGAHIPAGSMILLSPMGTHHLPEFWPQPDAFDPERFLAKRSEGRPRHAYYPFGGGPQQSIENNFALLEAQLVVATMVQKLTMTLALSRPMAFSSGATLKPRQGMQVRLRSSAVASTTA
jgi:cytochrome P450